jgi:hypothetical protein
MSFVYAEHLFGKIAVGGKDMHRKDVSDCLEHDDGRMLEASRPAIPWSVTDDARLDAEFADAPLYNVQK